MSTSKFKLAIILGFILSLCGNKGYSQSDTLFEKFQTPEVTSRPMVKWWWNDNRIDEEELKRELSLLKEAGIGGVEISPSVMRPECDDLGINALKWGGQEWSEMVKIASREAEELDMITDLLVSSGTPLGGQFIREYARIQRIRVKTKLLKPNTNFIINIRDYLEEVKEGRGSISALSVTLIPQDIHSLDEIIELSGKIKNSQLRFRTDDQVYLLSVVYIEKDFEKIEHGVLDTGAPVMDHFNGEATRNYFNRLKAIEKFTETPLNALVRALSINSIDLRRSNWNNEMALYFRQRNGYDLLPYLPFVLKSEQKNHNLGFSDDFKETIRRVRYDYHATVTTAFLDNFVREYQQFCTENDVLCRYQAQGFPEYTGLFQGNMLVDIPESKNGLYANGRDEAASSEYTWPTDPAYRLWSKVASSGAHIGGKSISSCETMSNTSGHFRTSLETIKQSDDMNFITGANHSILNGYNYSPPEAGFPRWVHSGTYFNEHNTWWKYFKIWTNYNSRLSSIFQNSDPVADIAIVSRLRDTWAETGRECKELHEHPWYYMRFWEAISRLGSTCDYISQPILENATVEGQELVCGEMRYKALFLADVKSLTPKASLNINKFAKAGGKIVFVGQYPQRSLSLKNANTNDRIVTQAINQCRRLANVRVTPAPLEQENFTEWTQQLFQSIGLKTRINIDQPESCMYTTTYTNGDKDIYFFSNTDRKKALKFDATFLAEDKTPYIWLPQTGERFRLPYARDNKLHIELGALESALIVFEDRRINAPLYKWREKPSSTNALKVQWNVKFEPINGASFEKQMDSLIDFANSNDRATKHFSGDVTYSATFNNDKAYRFIVLEEVNQAVTELTINGKKVGLQWYGKHIYDMSSYIQAGKNTIEIKLTTTLANYCMSLKNNELLVNLTKGYKAPFSSGLVGVQVGK